MGFEYSGRSKLSQLVPHHVFGDVYVGKNLTAVHQECESNEVRCDPVSYTHLTLPTIYSV